MHILKALFYLPLQLVDDLLRPYRIRRWHRQLQATMRPGEKITWKDAGYRLAPQLVKRHGWAAVARTTEARHIQACLRGDMQDIGLCAGIAQWLIENAPAEV